MFNRLWDDLQDLRGETRVIEFERDSLHDGKFERFKILKEANRGRRLLFGRGKNKGESKGTPS